MRVGPHSADTDWRVSHPNMVFIALQRRLKGCAHMSGRNLPTGSTQLGGEECTKPCKALCSKRATRGHCTPRNEETRSVPAGLDWKPANWLWEGLARPSPAKLSFYDPSQGAVLAWRFEPGSSRAVFLWLLPSVLTTGVPKPLRWVTAQASYRAPLSGRKQLSKKSRSKPGSRESWEASWFLA